MFRPFYLKYMSRSNFLTCFLFCCLSASVQPGKKFPSERKEYKDSITSGKYGNDLMIIYID
jgi:hypothetical protein